MNERVEAAIAERRRRQGHAPLGVSSPSLPVAGEPHHRAHSGHGGARRTGKQQRNVLLGIGISPVWAGVLRAVAYIVLTAAIDAAVIYLQAPPSGLIIYSATIVGALRAIEGLLDQAFKGDASAAAPGARG